METGLIHRSGHVAPTPETRQPPRAPVRSMQVMEALARAREGLSLAALSIALELPKTSLLHLLRALEAARYVRRVPAGFQLGERSYLLAALIDATDGFSNASQQVLLELLQQTRETVLLGKFTPGRMMAAYFERLPSPQPMRFTPELNEDRPLYCTAMGKVLLAFSPEKTVNAYLRSVTLQRFTPHTVRSKQALRDELASARQQGMALSVDEMVEGGGSLAAPVLDGEGRIRMALVIAAPSARLLPHSAAWAVLLKKGVERLSGMLTPLST
jgi:IclR family KDG regulon transcriptional repressor